MTATGYELSDLRGKRLRRDHQSPPDNSPEVLIRAHPDRRREPESNPRYPAQPQCVHESIEDNGPPARKGRALQPGQIILNDVPGSPAGDQGPPRREPPLVLQGQAQSGRMARPSMPSFRSDVPGQPQVPGSRPDPAENRAPVLSTGHHPAAPNLASSSSFGTGKVTTGRSPYGPRIVVAAPAPGPQSHSVSPGRPIEPYCPFFEPQYRGPAHLPEPVRGAPVSGRSTSIRSTRNYPPAPVSRHTSRPPLGLMAQPPAQVRVPLSRPGPATTRDPIGPPRSNSAAPPLLSASRVQSVDLTRGSPQSVLADRTRRVPSGMEWEELAQPMEPQLQPLPATRTGHFDSLQLAGASPNIGSRWPSAAARSARRIPTTPLPIPVSHAPSAPTIPAPVPVPALGHFHTPLQVG